jgi:AraC family transcriptional regulator, regulatory protein of adaptative response / methylated-DNA-[protein]-cysteine methyltransferase
MTTPTEPPDYHYHVIKRAIALIDAPGGTRLGLDELAQAMGMSAAHFQRVFSAWAGVSPKRYQQYLTLGHARALMAERCTLLDVAQETGLSGTARLHDLFLRWEAMSPGDYARRGAGLTIRYGWFDTPFGAALAMTTDRGLCGLAFADPASRDATLTDMATRWPKARMLHDPEHPAPHVRAAFTQHGDAALHMIGTPFQIKVWEALLQVPSGHVTTYGALANKVCTPRAARAVGTAVGRNPLGFLIPCHRVLRGGTSGLGGYHWGLERKRAILAWETARAEADCQPNVT